MDKLSRRQFITYGTGGALSLYLASRTRFLGTDPAFAAASPQFPLAAKAIPQFVDPLPDLLAGESLIAGETSIELWMREQLAMVLPAGAVPGYTGTYTWSYLKPGQASRTSYLGPVVLAARGTPIEMKFVNQLGNTADTNVLAYKYGTDQTLHWADPLGGEMNMYNHMAMPPAFGTPGAQNYDGPIPAVVHLHGGEVPPLLDGGPDAWVTSDGQHKGHGFYSKDRDTATNYHIYRYPNMQEGALIWFHDHTLGATRLNVYAGLAGGYLITDPTNDPANLPPLLPLVIQDRMFDANGQLFFPADSAGGVLWALNPEHPYWVPEFVGDVICVNGKSWPFKEVAPKRYTLMIINGSNARAYEMFLNDPVSGNGGPPLWVIATDGGYLDKPVQVGGAGSGKNNKLVMMSGERYQVIVDFAGYQTGVIGPNGLPYSGTWTLRNTAKTPFPNGGAAIGGTTGQIMQFRVVGTPGNDTSFNPATPGATLRGGAGQGPAVIRLANPATGAAAVTVHKTRQLTLNEVMGMPQKAIDPVTGVMTAYPGGPLEILVNNTKWSGERINGVDTRDPMMPMYTFEHRDDFTIDSLGTNYLSELPNEGENEIWEIVNLTADAHPIHLHLVQFQLMNRQSFDAAAYTAAYNAAFPGGGWDTMAVPQPGPYPAGVYIPGFGPPLHYTTGNPSALGGNPNINALSAKGKPLYLKGAATPPLPQEAGWKDTVIMYPGQVTRIAVRWAPTDLPANTKVANAFYPFDPRALGGGYVWHCHIVDHEDNEMMRPDEVIPNPNATRTYVQGEHY